MEIEVVAAGGTARELRRNGHARRQQNDGGTSEATDCFSISQTSTWNSRFDSSIRRAACKNGFGRKICVRSQLAISIEFCKSL